MIVLWQGGDIPYRDFSQYRHCLTKQAQLWGEAVLVEEDTPRNRARQWDAINTAPGRMVAWMDPEFIPHPTFTEEADLLRDADQLVVALEAYRAKFHPGQYTPATWEPVGVSRHLVIFQLTGQQKWTLPPSGKGMWRWLERTPRTTVFRVPQTYSGGAGRGVAMRSRLGEVVHDPWGGRAFGRVITGGARWCDGEQQRALWRVCVDGWERWLEGRNR